MQNRAQVERQEESPAVSPVKAIDANSKWHFEPLDKSSFTPRYFQIQAQLLKMIQRATAPGRRAAERRRTQPHMRRQPDDRAPRFAVSEDPGVCHAPQGAGHICQSTPG